MNSSSLNPQTPNLPVESFPNPPVELSPNAPSARYPCNAASRNQVADARGVRGLPQSPHISGNLKPSTSAAKQKSNTQASQGIHKTVTVQIRQSRPDSGLALGHFQGERLEKHLSCYLSARQRPLTKQGPSVEP